MASSEREPTASGSQDENKSEMPIAKDAVPTNKASEEKAQSSTGSGPANEAATPGTAPAAGQHLVADSDSESEEEEWDMSRMGFRGPIGVPVTGGGSLKRPVQKPRPKPSTKPST